MVGLDDLVCVSRTMQDKRNGCILNGDVFYFVKGVFGPEFIRQSHFPQTVLYAPLLYSIDLGLKRHLLTCTD